MRHAMTAAGAVVCLMLQIALPLVLRIEQLRLRVHDFVLVGGRFGLLQDDVVFRHDLVPARSPLAAAACAPPPKIQVQRKFVLLLPPDECVRGYMFTLQPTPALPSWR